ncbi:MAG: AraC family transcriptional regulator [Bacteroidia bacterium]|nr:AraC family transcriptional regulator [Bacteroidia bacterium]
MQPVVYPSLQAFFQAIGLPLGEQTELTVHRLEGLHGDGPMASPVFRTAYYTLILIQGGASEYTIDGMRYDLGPGAFYFTNPGHLKSFRIREPLSGYMVTCSERFLQQHAGRESAQQFPFLIHESVPVMWPGSDALEALDLIFRQMLHVYQAPSPFQADMLAHLLLVLLFKTRELLITHRAVIRPEGRSADLVLAFKTRLNGWFRQLASGELQQIPSVKALAEALHVHPSHLSDTLRELTGKPASAWIQERLLMEARAQLRHTSRPVSEIAFSLGFTDTAHFARFFRKHQHCAPGAYRRQPDL